MIALAAFAAILVAVLEPAPSPIASDKPLREITHVHATTPFCAALANDATGAVDLETRFDERLVDAENALAVVDLDSSPIAKMRGTSDVRARYVELASNIAASRKLMKSFAKSLKDAPTSDERADLQSFSNALDGALHHQQSLADELGRFLAYVDTHDPIDDNARDRMETTAVANIGNAALPRSAFDANDLGPTASLPPQLSTVAKAASTILIKRSEALPDDEASAASRIDAAFSRC